MRRLTAIAAALVLILAPVSSMITNAMGHGSEHIHYDLTWHSAGEWLQASVSEHAHPHDSDGGDEQDHARGHDAENGTAPIKHSHVDQVHAAAFVLVSMPLIAAPHERMTAVSAQGLFPLPQHPHPPFRPPQHT